MASSQNALRLLRRTVPTTPRLLRTITTTPRQNADAAPTKPPAPGASTSSNPPAQSKVGTTTLPHTHSLTGVRGTTVPKNPNPLHNFIPNAGSTDDNIPTYQYPAADPSPLPAVPSSYNNAAQAPTAAGITVPSPAPIAQGAAGTDPSLDWGKSFHGLSTAPFPPEASKILQAPIPSGDIEVKPDGIVYLPEIKYRRILNTAFGPGGWGLAPRGDLHIGDKVVTREFALIVGGRFVGQARGECGYYGDENIPNAVEGCKSNALTRCCKDLGIASELWDPRFIRTWKKENTKKVEVYYGTGMNARKRTIEMRKDDEVLPPYKLVGDAGTGAAKPSYGGAKTYAKPAGTTTYAAKKPVATTTAARPAAAAPKA